MPETVIAVDNLSKCYLVGHRYDGGGYKRYTALRDVIANEIRNFARKAVDVARGRQVLQGEDIEEFWALKDVSFEVKEGEVLGIIGRNGAGKSTLLKILSRITEPTQGKVLLKGRVGSLLEVGTGFHPELTGRENIYLNGAVLGMTRREIAKKFDEIVEFSGVERFLDTPVKRYSSGMYVRLAFAVAAHLEPDILVVDEVLAVGDADFQQKCLGKMNDVSRRQGRTVLFVSHNMGILSQLCPKAIWLERGIIRKYGETADLVSEYLSHGNVSHGSRTDLSSLPRLSSQENRVRLTAIEWRSGLPLRHGEAVKARIFFESKTPITNLAIGFGFGTLSGRRILTYDADLQDGYRPNLPRPGAFAVDVEIDELPLQPDTYCFDIGCRSGASVSLDFLHSALQIEVLAGPKTPSFIAYRSSEVRLKSRWTWDLEDPVGSPGNDEALTATL